MEVRYIGERSFMTGKIYVVLAIEGQWYRIVDESGKDYPYSIDSFEIVGGSEADVEDYAPIFEIDPNDHEELPGAALFKTACDLITNGQGKWEGLSGRYEAPS